MRGFCQNFISLPWGILGRIGAARQSNNLHGT
jgi:hypothetical protein